LHAGPGLLDCGMSAAVRILAFSGSARRESLNRKLLAVAVQATRDAEAEVTLLDLNDYALPLYHGDLEDAQGLPANATKLIELITAHPALLIASPEYNSYFTPLLKNTIDWCTRGDENPFVGKVAAVISASPGQYGGVRSATHLRALLLHLGCHIVPAQCNLLRADEAFDEQGALKDSRAWKNVQAVARDLVATTRRFVT
jgi:chromate reductase, NAD(P)H dehydrogenase (quinone)